MGVLMLLFPAVAAHSLLMDRWFARQPPGSYVGFAVLFAPILLVLVGEWIATDAGTQHWGRRGFAVVADEVRVLSKRTHSSTEEIRAMIETLQRNTQQAVGTMSQSQQLAASS